MANILGCDGIECYQAAVEEQGPGVLPPQQMATNFCAWLVGSFLVYPTSYPVMLKLMIWAEKMVGSLRPRTLFVLEVLAVIVAYAYMGFTEGLVAGLLNSTSSRLGTGNWWEIVPWVTATCMVHALLIAWNVYLYR